MMPHGQHNGQREGPYGPPPIQREMPPYDTTPSYWGPPPARYPRHRQPPQRVQPPHEYHHHHHHVGVAAPPLPLYHHHSQQQQHHHYGWQQRDSQDRHYAPPPPTQQYEQQHHQHAPTRRQQPAPRDEYGRPYMPMHVDNTQEQFHPPTAPVPRTPTIQFRPSPMDNTLPPFVSPAKKAKSSPGKDPKTGKKKKSDALSMLAKVSTAMADPKEEAEKAAAAQKEMEQQQQVQHLRSPQRQPEQQHSPVVMWTTPRPSERVQSRQITPTSTYDNHRHMPPPPRAGYNNNYAPPQQQQPYPPRYASSYPPPSYNAYRGDSPPAVISERGSFEEHSFGSPPRHEDPRFSPYTYVQQPRLEDKTILRKKFSWKHFPEVRER